MISPNKTALGKEGRVILHHTREPHTGLNSILSSLGFVYRNSRDGGPVAALAGVEKFPAVIVDAALFSEADPWLRCCKVLHHAKIIFFARQTTLAKLALGLSNGADEYLAEPFDAEIVLSKFACLGLIQVNSSAPHPLGFVRPSA